MKKTIKNILIGAIALCAVLTMSSCSNGYSFGTPQVFLSYEEAIDKLGDRSNIYNTTDNLSSRFYSGQILDEQYKGNIENKVVFDAKLVEYNSLNDDVRKYIDSIPDNQADSWMHQWYDIDFIEGKIYVEFASYTDMDNDKVMQFEIRVFHGDFWNHKNEAGWYAKSVLLSPDLTIDIRRGKNIKTGEKAHYIYPYAIYDNEFTAEDLQIDETKYFTGHNGYNITEEMLKLGTNPVAIDKPAPNICCNDENSFTVSRLFKYDTFYDNTEKEYEELKKDQKCPWGLWARYTEDIDYKYRYIEVTCAIDRKTDEVLYCDLRFFKPVTLENGENWEVVGRAFHEFDDFKAVINICQGNSNK